MARPMVRPMVLLSSVLVAVLLSLPASGSAVLSGISAVPSGISSSPPGSPVVAAAGASGGSGPVLRLVAQTPWVTPGEPMQITLSLGRAAASDELTVSVYSCLSTGSALAATVAGSSVGTLEETSTFPATSLTPGPEGSWVLTLPVDDGTTPVTGTGPLTARLVCPSGPTGVYPVRITADDGGNRTSLFTYLVYEHPPASTEKLRLAMVLPLTGPPTVNAGGTVPALSNTATNAVDELLSTLSERSDVPVTLAPEPAFVEDLGLSASARAHHALTVLDALASSSDHQTLAQSFVPIDPTTLVDNGLAGEVSDQLHRGSQALAPLHVTTNVMSVSGPLDTATVGTLARDGVSEVLMPASDVSIGGSRSLTPTHPFSLSGSSQSSIDGAVLYQALTTDMADATGANAALDAYRFLAAAALVYYEEPNLNSPRGVLAMGPGQWNPAPAFLGTLLPALATDPVLQPVTVDAFFGTVPTLSGAEPRLTGSSSSGGSGGSGGSGSGGSGSGGSGSGELGAVRSGRQKFSAFASAVSGPAAPTALRALDELLLRSEDNRLHSSGQQAAIQGFKAALDNQLHQLSVRTDTVRLTSSAAKVPITIVKQSPYLVSGTLVVSSDKVVFPPGTAQQAGGVCHATAVQSSQNRAVFSCDATIDQSTDAVYVDMRARAGGDFRLSVTLTSPSGHLVLATNELTVRSFSVSALSIVLSGVALAVLLLWWGRSWWRNRRPRRRGAHVRNRGGSDPDQHAAPLQPLQGKPRSSE
ncbi:MAG: hypothetical protein ACYDD4_00975 [Acidimicrobiales bacterium]